MEDDVKKIEKLLLEAGALIKKIPDDKISETLGNGILTFVRSIAEPKKNTSQTIYDYLLENKNRLTLSQLQKFE